MSMTHIQNTEQIPIIISIPKYPQKWSAQIHFVNKISISHYRKKTVVQNFRDNTDNTISLRFTKNPF